MDTRKEGLTSGLFDHMGSLVVHVYHLEYLTRWDHCSEGLANYLDYRLLCLFHGIHNPGSLKHIYEHVNESNITNGLGSVIDVGGHVN